MTMTNIRLHPNDEGRLAIYPMPQTMPIHAMHHPFSNCTIGPIIIVNNNSNIINLTSKTERPIKTEIIDLMGKVVLNSRNENSINVSTLKAGTYYLRIFTSNNIETQKIEILR